MSWEQRCTFLVTYILIMTLHSDIRLVVYGIGISSVVAFPIYHLLEWAFPDLKEDGE